MKRECVVGTIALGLLAFLSGTATAALSFNVGGGNEFSESGQTFVTSFTVKFEDFAANQVKLTVDATNFTSPSTGFITTLHFNSAGIDPTTVTVVGGSQTGPLGAVSFSTGTNAFKADGDGFFDFLIDFPNPAASRFNQGEIFTIVLTGIGLDETDFNAISVNGEDPNKNGFYVASHVQGLGTRGEGSGWFAGTPTAQTPGVPEPTSLAIWALGIAAAGFGARRMRKQK